MLRRFFGNRVSIPITAARSGGGPLRISDAAAPQDAAAAGLPFELPYTLNLPDREEDRWRTHLDVSRVCVRLVRATPQAGDPMDAQDGFLADLSRLARRQKC